MVISLEVALMPLPLLLVTALAGQLPERPTEGKPHVRATRLAEPVTIDGRLSEGVWSNDLAVSDFRQREPSEGAPASEATEVRLAYDDAAIYVGARMRDSDPGSIVARLGRRDSWLEADAFALYLDPYHDGRSGFFFVLNAAGTLRDGTLFNDDWDDDSWDGVWEGRVARDEQGWTAEMRIPYSQLRFHAGEQMSWGVNCRRYLGRKKEDDYLVVRPKKESGFVSRFAELSGIEGVTPPRRLSITPYATAKAELTRPDADDPFHDGAHFGPALGADAKLGLGSSLTLDLTLNPDFGQVEVDPAVVNLSDVETFYDEKRPFFVEGSSTFSFGSGGASNYFGFNWWGPDLFYSRRIGRAPQGRLPYEAVFTAVPNGTTILGAGKLTGKLGDHWNLGTLHAVTTREHADVLAAGSASKLEVEPASYYGVFRLQRDFPENRHGIGILGTAVVRDFSDGRLADQMSGKAFSLGLDGWTFLDPDKKWVITGWTALSNVQGTQARLLDLQQDPQHYFQRPDATHVSLDPTATSMTGSAGRASINKEKGNVLVNAALGWIDPRFEVNDAGFEGRSDLINGHVWGSYRWTQPGRVTRSAHLDLAFYRSYDFGGNRTWDGIFAYAGAELRNYYQANVWAAYNPETQNPTRTRGGPLSLNPAGWEWDGAVSTDQRKNFWARLGVHGSDYAQASQHVRFLSTRLEWRPRSNLSLSLIPEMEWNQNGAQWVGEFEDPVATATYGKRYVFTPLEQKTFVAGIRLNWTFSPRLSLQTYFQPLVSSGDYSDFGSLARPRSYNFDRDPSLASHFDNPDFNYKSLRGNAVLRWEYQPGSTLYFVWTQNRSQSEDLGEFQFRRSLGRLLDAPADNIFLIKISYWWNR